MSSLHDMNPLDGISVGYAILLSILVWTDA